MFLAHPRTVWGDSQVIIIIVIIFIIILHVYVYARHAYYSAEMMSVWQWIPLPFPPRPGHSCPISPGQMASSVCDGDELMH